MKRLSLSIVVVLVGLAFGYLFQFYLGKYSFVAQWLLLVSLGVCMWAIVLVGMMMVPFCPLTLMVGGLGTSISIAGFSIPYFSQGSTPWFTGVFLIALIIFGTIFVFHLIKMCDDEIYTS